jgi:hypothetical protein
MKKAININTVGTAVLIGIVITLVVCLICGNGQYIAHISINN